MEASNQILQAARQRAQHQIDEWFRVMAKEQLKCPHDDIAETSSGRPWRVCLKCGIQEEGYSFLVLTKFAREGIKQTISPDDLRSVHVGYSLFESSEDKTRLARKEITIQGLITEWYSDRTHPVPTT